ncbi:GIY-YIG nuclease family protein [Pseudomonas citronellolis]|uniref:GIY-YIG nuclease family protein n=1 Tax=Pseudomonas citronellolis TaxID=53408 RepID=UPI0026489ACE|nr:GIY-YIG nuclease family protein [Pseudomonas citronellolis]MDN6871846.1 GIY-YIG nuclease family protein [Pseudomonas citronellolis]
MIDITSFKKQEIIYIGNDMPEQIGLLPYYVYELRDPQNNEVFYVGKGQGNRVDSHDSALEDEKGRRIQEIKERWAEHHKVIVARFATEEEALSVEAVLIKWVYGLDKLTNKIHSYRQKNIRPAAHRISGSYEFISGIDIERTLEVVDGAYNERLHAQIRDNQIEEKLASLRDNLSVALKDCFENNPSLNLSKPDLSVPMDPCLWLIGFDVAVSLQLKLQLTGNSVKFNFRPTRPRGKEKHREFLAVAARRGMNTANSNSSSGVYATKSEFHQLNYDDLEKIALQIRSVLREFSSV